MEELAGFRSALMAFREVAELLEKNPGFPVPRITFNQDKEALTGEVYFHISSYTSYAAGDYDLPADQRKEAVRLRVENQINTIVEAFGAELEWVSNDPSEDSFAKNYFTLTAEWQPGVKVQVMTGRDAIGEMIDVVESGPQVLTDGDGTVQLVRQTATIWKPNISIGRRATPAYELEAAPLVLAVTA